MSQALLTIASLETLLDASSRPIYAVDERRRIVYCNAALAAWVGLDVGRIVGRGVEFHSQPSEETPRRNAPAPPLTDLCPPPESLAGAAASGTIGCVDRGGRLVHRRAEFVPLAADDRQPGGVLVFVAAADLSPQELAAELSAEPTADELHRAIRRFRREQAAEFAIESLLGQCAPMQKVRAQVAAAATCQANVLVRGRPGTGREHVARAIHYRWTEASGTLALVDCAVATEDSLRRAIDAAREVREAKQRNSLLLLNVEHLPLPLQMQLLPLVVAASPSTRWMATTTDGQGDEQVEPPPAVHPQLSAALSTMTIDVPPLAARLEDLPLLAQCFLEAANRGSAKQIGSIRPEALDELALYRWPGELAELRRAIESAHAAATTHEITLADLPPVVHHAAKAAALTRRQAERIVLDELLESIEREVISRALVQASGNKSAAAELLGITRPRLYRRLVQLGLIQDGVEDLAS